MSKEKSTTLQEKVKGLYDRIGSDFYLNRDDLEVNGESYNSALLLGTLTELNKGNQLLFGEYGGGKTTSAEYLNSIFNGLPLDLVKRVAIRGNPQLTEEKMVGRPHYGKMHKGEEDVVWQHFVQVGPKIFDEFNRLPESNQAVVLNGVDRGEWNYLNDFIFTGKQPFFATCNYADRGNNGLIPPILDRFDVAVESKFPGVSNVLHIAQDYHNEKDKVLSDPKLTHEALEILNSGKSYVETQKELEKIVKEHEGSLIKKGFSILSTEDKARIEEEIREIPLDKDAEQYFAFLISEMNTSPKYGQKRSIDPQSSEHGLYLQAAFVGSGSRREEKSIYRYAQALAWLQDQKEVNLDHLTQVAPYVLWHRVNWSEETENKFRDDTRQDPLPLHITKTLLGDGTAEIPGVKKRFAESQENYQRVIDLVGHNKIDEAIKEAKECAEDGRGHPIFSEVVKRSRRKVKMSNPKFLEMVERMKNKEVPKLRELTQILEKDENGRPKLDLIPLEKTAVNTPTQQEYNTLMQVYECGGWEWLGGDLPTQDNIWKNQRKETFVLAGVLYEENRKNIFQYGKKCQHLFNDWSIISPKEFYDTQKNNF